MVGDSAGGHAKRRVDDSVNPACQPATGRAGHNKRADEAAPRGKHEQGADNRDHRAGSKRPHHGISSRQSTAMTNLPRSLWPHPAETSASVKDQAEPIRQGSLTRPTAGTDVGPDRLGGDEGRTH